MSAVDCENLVRMDGGVEAGDELARCRPSAGNGEDSAPSGGGGRHGEAERRRRPRRRKTKRKNPYRPAVPRQGKKPLKRALHQPDAPYNTNQFLIEDHQDFDVKLMAVGDGTARPPRKRDPSFTSAESDQEFYSSPEDEEEFLTKEFSNTYRDVHVESLGAMSKNDLIQTVLQLEEKVDLLEKRLGKFAPPSSENPPSVQDKEKYLQSEICKLVLANEELLQENEKLRAAAGRLQLPPGSSSEDSESDSSSSSGSSDLTQSDSEDTTTLRAQRFNGQMDCEPDTQLHPPNVT